MTIENNIIIIAQVKFMCKYYEVYSVYIILEYIFTVLFLFLLDQNVFRIREIL